jgi:glutathione S-transferase
VSIDPNAKIEITAFDWVPEFARGFVRDLRPRWACEELGLPYRVRLISAMERPQWFYAEQPWGQVPVLRDGDIQLFESGAILLYLARLIHDGGVVRLDWGWTAQVA